MTTINADGTTNISPMGPVVDENDAQLARFTLRPFRTSTTYANLKRTGQGVLHVTDDVLLIARAAIGRLDELPPLFDAAAVDGCILADACRWYAFRVESLDDSRERTEITCRTVDSGHIRDFFGLNRAKHAVIEAAILATRIGILPGEDIRRQMESLAPPVEKTGGTAERAAFELLREYIDERLRESE